MLKWKLLVFVSIVVFVFVYLYTFLKSVTVKNDYCLGCVSVYQETISLIARITLHTKHRRRLNIFFLYKFLQIAKYISLD